MKDYVAGAAIPSDGVVIFAEGTTCCAACAPRVLNRDQVERAALEQAPRYSSNEGCIWTVFAGHFPDRQPNPRPCPHDVGRQHWLLVCSP